MDVRAKRAAAEVAVNSWGGFALSTMAEALRLVTRMSQAQNMVSYVVSHQAYVKIFFHAAKHPHRPVNGVLLGKSQSGSVTIEDSIPLLHHWTSLSPMMEIGLDLVSALLVYLIAIV